MYSYVLLASNTSARKEYKSQSKACFEVGRAVLEAQRVGERGGAAGEGWLGGGKSPLTCSGPADGSTKQDIPSTPLHNLN